MKCWDNLKRIFKRVNHGVIKITVENGVPVSVPEQAIMKRKGTETKVKVVKRTIDLTK